jgi:hypothetical protein
VTAIPKGNVGKLAEINVRLEVGDAKQTMEVSAQAARVPVSTEGRLWDTLERKQITDLPIPQRDVFFLTSLSAGATNVPGTVVSSKLVSSPIVAVNGNRYRGNNFVLDGSMDTNILSEGEPAIVPSLESIAEVQVQTGNFSSEYGRGNGSVVNIRTKSGTNDLHGRVWEYHKNAALDARNFFAPSPPHWCSTSLGLTSAAQLSKTRCSSSVPMRAPAMPLARRWRFRLKRPSSETMSSTPTLQVLPPAF